MYAIKHIPTRTLLCEDDSGYYLTNDDAPNLYDTNLLPSEVLICSNNTVKTDMGDFHIDEFKTIKYNPDDY